MADDLISRQAAIKAIENLQQNNGGIIMDDTVYRKDVIKALEDMSGGYSYIETTTLGAITTIRELPSAQRTGRWIVVDEQEPRRYGCSECKRLVWHIENYCPNCGCAMEGEEE